MKTRVRVTTLVDVPFSAISDLLAEVLRTRSDLLVSPVAGAGEHVHLVWDVVDDVGDEVRKHEAIAFSWTPAHARLFPALRGSISVRPHFRRSWMRIAGEYDPPLAGAGRIFDLVAGRYVAWRTLRRIAQQLRRDVELRYRVNL